MLTTTEHSTGWPNFKIKHITHLFKRPNQTKCVEGAADSAFSCFIIIFRRFGQIIHKAKLFCISLNNMKLTTCFLCFRCTLYLRSTIVT